MNIMPNCLFRPLLQARIFDPTPLMKDGISGRAARPKLPNPAMDVGQ